MSVLIALLDADHDFHDTAHEWFERIGRSGWATCPITENGVVRIMGSSRYPMGFGNPGAVAAVLRNLTDIEGHQFWADEVSLLSTPLLDISGLGSSKGVTDTYLLALAVSKRGKFATLDRKLSPAAVRGGADALHIIA